MLTRFFDNTKPRSLANYFRRRRFKLFKKILAGFEPPVKILDAGGTQVFWEMMGLTAPDKVNITIINTEEIDVTLPNFRFIMSDVRDLSLFKDKEFDIVFSNSVIEHVGTFEEQKKMADEIMRVGAKYFVQTPNYYFPYEPHFMQPLFQFFPSAIKVWLVMKYNLGWYKKCSTKEDALLLINSVRLLKKSDIIKLFPGAKIFKEKFLFFTKSFIAY